MDNIASSIWNFFSGLPLIPSSKGVAESWLSRAELSLVVFALVIGVGLVAEDRAERKETKWIPPHRGWNWKRIFAWVVAAGVIAELFSDAAIWVSSDALQAISDGEILALAKRAGDAEQVANRAKNQAETAIAALDDAQRRLAEISDKESELEQRQSDFLDALTPRELEYGKFADDLAGVTPVPIVIEAEPDPDSQYFAPDLWVAFSNARWRERSVVQQPLSFNPGILVKYLYPPTDDTARKAAQAICRALNAQLLTNAKVYPASTLEMQHEQYRKHGFPEDVWVARHRNGPGAFDWPDSAPSGAVIVHLGQNRSDLFFDRARIKKGLRSILIPQVDRTPPCEG
jgi:hypothetical protein